MVKPRVASSLGQIGPGTTAVLQAVRDEMWLTRCTSREGDPEHFREASSWGEDRVTCATLLQRSGTTPCRSPSAGTGRRTHVLAKCLLGSVSERRHSETPFSPAKVADRFSSAHEASREHCGAGSTHALPTRKNSSSGICTHVGTAGASNCTTAGAFRHQERARPFHRPATCSPTQKGYHLRPDRGSSTPTCRRRHVKFGNDCKRPAPTSILSLCRTPTQCSGVPLSGTFRQQLSAEAEEKVEEQETGKGADREEQMDILEDICQTGNCLSGHWS